MGPNIPSFEAWEDNWQESLCYFVEDDLVQLAGIYALEAFIEHSITHRLNSPLATGHNRKVLAFDPDKLANYEQRKTSELRQAGGLAHNEYFELNQIDISIK